MKHKWSNHDDEETCKECCEHEEIVDGFCIWCKLEVEESDLLEKDFSEDL